MLRDIHLGGQLGKKYGCVHRFDIATPAEAVRALEANHPGFLDELLSLGRRGYGYRVLHGKGFKSGLNDAGQLADPISGPIKIVPAISGAKRGGVGQILAAIAMVVAAIYLPGALTGIVGEKTATLIGSSLMSTGIAMGLGGVIQLLSPQQKSGTPEEDKKNPSYVFDGPVNTMAQGHPVPVGYGELIVGSAVISASIRSNEEAIPGAGSGGSGGSGGGTGGAGSGGTSPTGPEPTLVWDDPAQNWRLADGEYLIFDERWVGGEAGYAERTNYRTNDGRVPTLTGGVWSIPSPTSKGSWRTVNGESAWYIVGGSVKVTLDTGAQRYVTSYSNGYFPGDGG